MRPRITLLTDFGTADGYVAAMRGVIAARAPQAVVEDASHEIPFGDVRAASFALARYWKLYPPGTVHVVVVDPGVGSGRRAIAVLADERLSVGPDNGVLEPMLQQGARIHAIERELLFVQPVSQTFHGRDIFAPVAAYLASGGLLEQVGPRVEDPVRNAIEPASRDGDVYRGRVVHVDRFGNLVTNIRAGSDVLDGDVEVEGKGIVGRVRSTYADALPGEVVAVTGSDGHIEISVRDGSAARNLGVVSDTRVTVRAARPTNE
jgi:S-adenosylmethionine hydrolase